MKEFLGFLFKLGAAAVGVKILLEAASANSSNGLGQQESQHAKSKNKPDAPASDNATTEHVSLSAKLEERPKANASNERGPQKLQPKQSKKNGTSRFHKRDSNRS